MSLSKVEEVNQAAFCDLLHARSSILLANALDIIGNGAESFVLTRPLLTMVQAESSQLEELLDAYGARRNVAWHPFRMHVAMLKNFSNAGYELLHLRHTLHAYEFTDDVGAFENATDGAITYVTSFLYCSLSLLLEDVKKLPLPEPEPMNGFDFSEVLPKGILANDREIPVGETEQQLVTRLATLYLNDTEDALFLDRASKSHGPNWRGLDFDRLSEASIHTLEGKFHAMQSIYDTYVSHTAIEGVDKSLRLLRGHISVVLHLLRVLTVFIHFYERHIRIQGDELFCRKACVLKSDWYIELITHYLCKYSYSFLAHGRGICQQMLSRYAVVGTIEIPVPPYFGFHVRPATLISTIVRHYGSTVTMHLDKDYDASVPMNLFLANEWINQVKRQYVASYLLKMDPFITDLQSRVDSRCLSPVDAVNHVLRTLATDNVIRVLVYPLKVCEVLKTTTVPTLLEMVQVVVANLHAQRHININYSIKVQISGDCRVLQDIKCLADNTYGENEHGSNIALPAELSYLSHSRAGGF